MAHRWHWAYASKRRPTVVAFLVLCDWASRARGGASCHDEASCTVRAQSILDRLTLADDAFTSGQLNIDALGNVRSKLASGKRFELPTVQRQHLMSGSPVAHDVTFDLKHRPVSTTLANHFRHVGAIQNDSVVKLFEFIPLKQSTSAESTAGLDALVATVNAGSQLSIYTLEGVALVSDFDLGHWEGSSVTALATSPSPENRFILTADDYGLVRIHNLQVKVKWEKAAKENTDKSRRTLTATPSFSSGFTIYADANIGRDLTAIVTFDHESKQYVVVGDSAGVITVFSRSGTVRSRVKVTNDAGGVRGLLRGEDQTILFYSAADFGVFSTANMEVLYPLCKEWSSPIVSIAHDPRNKYSEVVIAFADGDVLVFRTPTEKDMGCYFVMKFPRVSLKPFQLGMFQGYAVGLPWIASNTSEDVDALREFYFFNVDDMRKGVGDAHTRTITVQAAFRHWQPVNFAMLPTVTHQSKRATGLFAIQFEGKHGIELYNVSVKMLPDGRAWLPPEPPWWPLLLKLGAVLCVLIVLIVLQCRKRWRKAAEEAAKKAAQKEAEGKDKGQGQDQGHDQGEDQAEADDEG